MSEQNQNEKPSSDLETYVLKETMEPSNESEKRRQAPLNSSCLPRGEPSYCNYTVGAGGSSFNGLSLTDFLDKFMEKKPTQNTWHSGSQIKRSKEDCYLNGVLIFARTIGDSELKTAYSFHCLLFTSDLRLEIQHIILTKDVEFLILACDGMWDVFSSQNSVSNVKQELSRQELSRPQGRMFTRVAQYKPLMFTKALLFIKKVTEVATSHVNFGDDVQTLLFINKQLKRHYKPRKILQNFLVSRRNIYCGCRRSHVSISVVLTPHKLLQMYHLTGRRFGPSALIPLPRPGANLRLYLLRPWTLLPRWIEPRSATPPTVAFKPTELPYPWSYKSIFYESKQPVIH